LRYEAVIFDMGDIFFDAGVWRRALVAHLRRLGVDIDYPRLCERWEAKLVDVYVGRREYWSAFREFLDDLGLGPADAEDTIAFARNKAAGLEDRVLFDGVVETLAELHGMGVKLAVLSDTESREQRVRQRLADLHIEQYFDAVITSADIGHVKPEREAFAAAAAALGVGLQRCAFVGHDVDELAGARDAGLLAIAFNHPPDAPADTYIRHFRELKEVLTASG